MSTPPPPSPPQQPPAASWPCSAGWQQGAPAAAYPQPQLRQAAGAWPASFSAQLSEQRCLAAGASHARHSPQQPLQPASWHLSRQQQHQSGCVCGEVPLHALPGQQQVPGRPGGSSDDDSDGGEDTAAVPPPACMLPFPHMVPCAATRMPLPHRAVQEAASCAGGECDGSASGTPGAQGERRAHAPCSPLLHQLSTPVPAGAAHSPPVVSPLPMVGGAQEALQHQAQRLTHQHQRRQHLHGRALPSASSCQACGCACSAIKHPGWDAAAGLASPAQAVMFGGFGQ